MNTIEEIRAKCIVDPTTGCWLWRGAGSKHGRMRIHALDHRGVTKRVMNGPLAIWNIAHGESPPVGYLPYRSCGNAMCAHPVHLRLARGQGDLMRIIGRQGRLKGTNLEQRRAAALKGRIAQGMVDTPDDVVRQILSAEGNNCAVARRLGVHHTVVSRVRRAESHKHIERRGQHELDAAVTASASVGHEQRKRRASPSRNCW